MILRKIKDKGMVLSTTRIFSFLVLDRLLLCEVKVIVQTTAKHSQTFAPRVLALLWLLAAYGFASTVIPVPHKMPAGKF